MEPADTDDVAAAGDGEVAGTVQLPGGGELPVTLDADLVERAQAEGVDVDRLREAAVPSSATVDLTAQTDGDSTATIPVQDHRETDLTSRRAVDRDFSFIQDDQIRRLIRQGVNYTERVGHFLLARDDLIPTVKERLKALIVGEDGLDVEPADPDSDADQRLADHLEALYEDDIRPTNIIDSILRENMMNARAVLRATDLRELDLGDLDYLRDGVTGEEIYVQDRATVYTFELEDGDGDGDDAIGGIDLETRTFDPQPLVIGEHVFDISLYDTPPLEAVADTAVNKMVLQRLKARKAEITSFGAVYAKVEPPSYLPEDQYFDRVPDDDWDGEGQPPTKLERALEQNIQSAFDTLKDFQSGTVMSVPDFWTLEQLDIPETDDPIDDQIRGYNRDISRRLLVPLDLIELQSGSELSRETMFATLMTTIAGWRREIKRVFDQFADVQADIEGISGDVEHTFPPLKDANAKQVISALQYAGIGGLTEKEVRQMMNTIQGVDLETDDSGGMPPGKDGSAPPEGGPDDPDQKTQQMRQMLDDQRRGPGGQDQDGQQGGQQAAQAADVEAVVQTLRGAAADAQRSADDADGDVDFQMDFPVSHRPNIPSRVSVASVKQVTGGRLTLPRVPQKAIQADALQRRVDDMVLDIVDDVSAVDAFRARIAERPPDHQPFVDIVDSVDADVVEDLANELPESFMTLFDAIEGHEAGGQGNVNLAGGAGTTVSSATTGTAAGSGGRLTADTFSPELHPRDPDTGEFIEVPGDFEGALKTAQDITVDATDEDLAERAADKWQNVTGETLDRFKSGDVAERTLGGIGELFVNDFRTGINFAAGRDKDQSSFEVQAAARPDTWRHELGHAIADGHGYGISVDAAREGDQAYDSDDDNFVPVDLDRDDLDEFRLTQQEGKDVPDEVAGLMDAVNDAWETTQAVGQGKQDGELDEYRLKSNYSALNAHEFLAQLHEELQSDTLPANANWFYRYDDLLPAYLEVAEPSDRVKELITFLHNNRDGSPFDEDPYPEITPEM